MLVISNRFPVCDRTHEIHMYPLDNRRNMIIAVFCPICLNPVNLYHLRNDSTSSRSSSLFNTLHHVMVLSPDCLFLRFTSIPVFMFVYDLFLLSHVLPLPVFWFLFYFVVSAPCVFWHFLFKPLHLHHSTFPMFTTNHLLLLGSCVGLWLSHEATCTGDTCK